jgi:hypothetical protein
MAFEPVKLRSKDGVEYFALSPVDLVNQLASGSVRVTKKTETAAPKPSGRTAK